MLIMVIGALLLAPSVHGLDWPHWRGAEFNGISKESDWSADWPDTGPKVIWRASVGTGYSSFSIGQRRVFTVGNNQNQETVYCFEEETGAEIWHHSFACPLDPKYYEGGPSATPTIDGARVYYLSRKGHLMCLDAATGKVHWQKNIAQELNAAISTWGFASSPVIRGNALFINVGSAGTALDKETGKVLWSSGKKGAGYSSAVPFQQDGHKALAWMTGKAVKAVAEADGTILWQHTWKTRYDVNAADPICRGNQIFISSGYNQGCALLEIRGGKIRVVWQNKAMRNHFNSCVYIDGYLYGFDEADLKCLDWKTGDEKWSQGGLGKGALMAADGKLIVLGGNGILTVAPASPSSFLPTARAQILGKTCWSTPVLANGRIYCRNSKGQVVCLDARPPSGSPVL